MNDSGAIVGTATYTPTGTTDPIAAGSHGVLLLPDQITRDGNPIAGTNANVWVGQQINLTNAKGELTTYYYNSNNQLTSVTGPQTGATVSFTYDGFGRVRTTTDLNGYVKTYDYDALNRRTQITYPDGSTEQFVYTNLDLTLSKDRQNRWTQYLYNAVEQMVGVVDPQGRATTYERCLCGALKGLVDANGHRTKWDQDLEGRTISKTYFDGTGYAYTYENNTSRLKTVTDPKSQVTTYAYNDDDTLNQAADADSTLAYSYDTAYPRLLGVTKTITATSVAYPTTYTYNNVWASGAPITGGGRVHTETGPLGSTAAVTFSYDELGRVLGTSINGVSSSVTYDSLGRMNGATNPLGTFTYGYYGITPRLHTVSNNQNGLNTSYSYQSGTGQDFRLTDISNYSSGTTVLSKFDYGYNAVGTIATEQEQTDSNTPTLWTYGYDNADQLNSATRTNTSTNAVLSQYVYGYDLAGNRTSEQIGLSVTQTSVNSLNQITSTGAGGPLQFSGTLSKPSQVTVAGQVATPGNYYSTNFAGMANVTTGTNAVPVVAHDVNGNTATNNYQVVVPSGASTSPTYDLDGNMLTSGNGQAYTWDAKNEMLSIVYSAGANSGNHTEFAYDALGRRIAIMEKTGTTVGSGTVTSTKQFVWVGTNPAEERDASDNVTKRFFAQGEQISGTNYYYTRDHLGSVREMVDNSGNIQSRYDYDPYGRVTKVSGSLDSDFQYAGYYEHAPSGLNLTEYRAYDPIPARWLSRDPIAEQGGVNLYGYVGNDPTNAIDPQGKIAVPIMIGVGIVGAATIAYLLYRWYEPPTSSNCGDIGNQIAKTQAGINALDASDGTQNLSQLGLSQVGSMAFGATPDAQAADTQGETNLINGFEGSLQRQMNSGWGEAGAFTGYATDNPGQNPFAPNAPASPTLNNAIEARDKDYLQYLKKQQGLHHCPGS